ncbi:unnamed protein product [Mytilus edulis]|uniref:Tyr recombinase domain-containing protein n=1 Tax=Mytilus edulis TaxID=6550 RepID=A0A8S3TDV1_MYTED|nr:unnamed protein product [Mytilus edulis]
MAKSLKEDINKRLVECSRKSGSYNRGVDGGVFLERRPPCIPPQHAGGGRESPTHQCRTEVRNCLTTLLILTNAKRAGDITHLTKEQVIKGKSAKGEDVELLVFEHKEAKSGKKCQILVTGEVLAFLKKYDKHVPNTTKYMFVTKSGTEISSSSMSKMVNAEWQKFGKSIDKKMPKLTASLNRKLAVTTIKEAGADLQTQTVLAKHMAHKPETAERFYDKHHRTSDRHSALDSVQGQYTTNIRTKGRMGCVSSLVT